MVAAMADPADVQRLIGDLVREEVAPSGSVTVLPGETWKATYTDPPNCTFFVNPRR